MVFVTSCDGWCIPDCGNVQLEDAGVGTAAHQGLSEVNGMGSPLIGAHVFAAYAAALLRIKQVVGA
jgi:hypothetical protein